MSEIRLITSSDCHVSDQNPGFRKDIYRDAILDKLVWQGEFARRFDSDAVIRAGDLFHVKEANKTTMATLAKLASIHRGYSCPTFAASGNHDMSRNDPSSISRQPLGVLLKSEVFQPLIDQRFISGSMRVRAIGVDYTVDMDYDGLCEKVRKVDGDTFTVAFVHALASMAPDEKIQSFFNERIFDYRDLVFEGCPDVYVFGHYHKDQGIQEHNGVKFVNLGAVSRGALTFENLERRPKISSMVFNSSGISIEEHEIPVQDASKVFDFEKKKVLERERKNIDEFIAKLASDRSGSGDRTIDDLMKDFQAADFPQDLKNLLLTTLEAAEAGTLDG